MDLSKGDRRRRTTLHHARCAYTGATGQSCEGEREAGQRPRQYTLQLPRGTIKIGETRCRDCFSWNACGPRGTWGCSRQSTAGPKVAVPAKGLPPS